MTGTGSGMSLRRAGIAAHRNRGGGSPDGHRSRGFPRTIGVLVAVIVALLAGCGFDPSDHALPGTGVDGPSYRLNLEFESLLSLPAGAVVRSDGAEVGTLRGIELAPHAAIARIEVRADARFPRGTRAELRQTTVLGDIYLALLPPVDGGAEPLRDGDTIPLRDTDPGPQLEQILDRMAVFVNGGSLTRMQDAIDQLNAALPADPAETGELGGLLAADLGTTADHLPDLERMLAAADATTRRLHDMRDEIGFLFSETAKRRLGRVPEFMTAVLNVVIDVNTLTTGLDWTIPRLPNLNVALEQTAGLLREPSADPRVWAGSGALLPELLSGRVIPFLTDPAIDVRTLRIEGNPELDAAVLLRLIGAAP
ncbi:MlaD family protein [Nocardia asteroides]|uniref:MlaD family protein n=1 Tax=Nocardia asteroides TaxID=1824 RepID=UPI001E3C3C72|nr:MlaD family protein [Nocardia asteroides]UGT60932.1 MlaD family protein [Nocardia asteroides]